MSSVLPRGLTAFAAFAAGWSVGCGANFHEDDDHDDRQQWGQVALPEGLVVIIEPSPAGQEEAAVDETGETLGQKLLKHAGKAVGLPRDLAENHDYYLYGTPRK